VRGVFFHPGSARATLTFADGTTDEWAVQLNPKSSPGWKLIDPLPPACAARP
jgi:hypothetical protein